MDKRLIIIFIIITGGILLMGDIIYVPEDYPTIQSAIGSSQNGDEILVSPGTYAENNLRAKSGYMKNIRAYAGYVTNRNEEQLAFAIIINNYNCSAFQMKKKLEKLMILIAEMK